MSQSESKNQLPPNPHEHTYICVYWLSPLITFSAAIMLTCVCHTAAHSMLALGAVRFRTCSVCRQGFWCATPHASLSTLTSGLKCPTTKTTRAGAHRLTRATTQCWPQHSMRSSRTMCMYTSTCSCFSSGQEMSPEDWDWSLVPCFCPCFPLHSQMCLQAQAASKTAQRLRRVRSYRVCTHCTYHCTC